MPPIRRAQELQPVWRELDRGAHRTFVTGSRDTVQQALLDTIMMLDDLAGLTGGSSFVTNFDLQVSGDDDTWSVVVTVGARWPDGDELLRR